MKLTEKVLKRPIATFMIVLSIIVFGISSVFGMPLELTPEMSLPVMGVITIYPTAGPEDVEKLVSSEIEGAVGSLSGMKNIQSFSMENISIVAIEYEYGTNMDIAYTDLKEKLDGLENTLPDTVQTPRVLEIDVNALDNMTVSVTSNDMKGLLYTVEEELKPEFEKLPSVANVNIYGGTEEYVKVQLKQEQLQQYGVNLETIIQSLASADFSIPAGESEYGNRSLAVRSVVEYNSVEELRNVPVPIGNGNSIRLSDIADIYPSTKDTGGISLYNGQENINIGIQKRQSASAVNLSHEVTKIIEDLELEYTDIEFDIVNDSSEIIVDSLTSVGSTLVVAIALSMVVLYVFLGDWKASLIIGSSMPVSVLVALILMSWMGFTLNIITLSSLVLGVGMMVDNSIVVLDSCFKEYNHERGFREAAIEGSKFVLLSVVASTATTVVVFLPLVTIPGVSGQLFKPLGFTITFSLIASLISAMTLVPLFFVRYEPQERKTAPAAKILKRVEYKYGHLLRRLMNKKKTVVGVSIALLAASIWMATQLNVELIETIDEGVVSIEVDAMPGLTVDRVDEIMDGLEDLVSSHPDVERYTYTVSGSEISLTNIINRSSGTVTAYLSDDRKMETDEIVNQWRKETAEIIDCELSINSQSIMSTFVSDDIEYDLKGNNLDDLRDAAYQVAKVAEEHPDIVRVVSTVEDPTPQLEVKVDPVKAAAYGYTPIQVASELHVMLSGVETVALNQDGQEYEIWVEFPDDKFENVSDLSQVILVSPYGTAVPLEEIGEIVFTDTPQTIRRDNNQYMVSVTATPTHEAKFSAEQELNEMMDKIVLPEGVVFSESQMQEIMDEEFSELFKAIATAIFLVFIVMAIQFESVKYSLMVMVSIPFSLVGSFFLMYITNTTVSLVSLLGFLILVGTVVNNGILFVDTTNEYRKDYPLETALIRTGRHRLRPILMTTLTTVLSMIPLAIGMGSGAEMMSSMGIVVIGGLTASTLLTLLMMPSFYLLLDGNPERKAEKQKKREQRKEKRREKDSKR